jgi:hypothetical protein
MLLWNGLLHQRFGQEIRHVKDLNRWSGSLLIWTGIRIVGFITTFFTRDTFMLMAVNENAHDNKPVKIFWGNQTLITRLFDLCETVVICKVFNWWNKHAKWTSLYFRSFALRSQSAHQLIVMRRHSFPSLNWLAVTGKGAHYIKHTIPTAMFLRISKLWYSV